MTGGWLLVIPALLLLFLLFHLHFSNSCLRLLFFSRQPEPLPLSIPCFRVLRVLHRPTHPETSEYLHCYASHIKPKVKQKNRKTGYKRLSCRFHSLSRPAVQFGRRSQVFPLPGAPSAPSGQTPPLILLLLPLTDTCIKSYRCVCLTGVEMWEHCRAAVYPCVILAAV